MTRVLWLLALVLLVPFLSAPSMAGEVRTSLRLAEVGAPGYSLRQLAMVNQDVAAALSDIRAQLKKTSRLRVVVKTAVAFAPETLLGGWERTVQRREIANAAATLQKAFPKARDFRALPDMPYVLVTVDQTALARLESVPGLVSIVPEDRFNWMRDFVDARSAAQSGMPAKRSLAAKALVSPKISFGDRTIRGTHPFQVALLNRNVRSVSAAQFCGGTLVSPYHVVTAAHCSDFSSNQALQILAGTQTLSSGGKRYNISRIYLHPGFDPKTKDNDVAVWELSVPVWGIPFAKLADTEPTTPATKLRVTGWGVSEWTGTPVGNYLRQADQPYVPTVNGKCGRWSGITPSMLCAGWSGEDSCDQPPVPGDGPKPCIEYRLAAPCYGDSGGPLTIDRGNGYVELVGIVSWGPSNCHPLNYPSVYANVAESGVNSFIRNIINASRAFEFQVGNYEVNEAGRRLTLTVTRTLAAGRASVVVATVPGSAAARADFRAVSRKLSFRPGVTSASVTISIVNDRLAEGLESFTVMLSSPSAGFSLGDKSTATVSITDDELAATSQSASR